MTVFARFPPRLQEAIASRLGWSSLRPVQEEAGAALLEGKNAVVLAPTAGGKTEASIFPTLSLLMEKPFEGIGAIYIAPIKALLNNQAERLGLYTEMVGLERFVWHGDTPDNERKQFLREPADLLMTTPESLEVMLVSQRIDEKKLFKNVRIFIVDEVHALAGTDRGAHLMSVMERIAAVSAHDVQRVGLSATVGNPAAILEWIRGTSKRDGVVVDPPKGKAQRQLLVVHRPTLPALARDASKLALGKKSLFFCQSRAMTETVAENMRGSGTDVFVHHSAVSREERHLAEERFHHGTNACIACTSTLELGIDVGDLDLVLQAEAPATVSSFLQRMGRTGRRAGKPANTTFFCESSEAVVQAIALIELARVGWVESVDVQDRCWPVLVHQLLAMSLGEEGISAQDAWTHLSRVPDFQGIHRAEFDRLVAWMLRDESLVLLDGRLLIGPKAEKKFGRKNFMELYAVFTSPQSYTVQLDAGAELGTLNQEFVDRLVESVSCFLLGGRPWLVSAINHPERVVKVKPAPSGREPTWGGYLPQYLGFDLCQKILDVLTGADEPAYLNDEARVVLQKERDSYGGGLRPRRGGVEFHGDEIRWWTFAGGRVNSTLRYALQALHPDWRVIPDNFVVKIRGNYKQDDFHEAVRRLADLDFWEDEDMWRAVATSLPNYRLSKFQPLVPPWVEREMLAEYLIDVAGAWRWVASANDDTGAPELPEGFRQPSAAELALPPREPEAPPTIEASRPVEWIASDAALLAVCAKLAQETRIGVDVETTLGSRTLCLIQVAGGDTIYLIDALEVANLEPLASVLTDENVTKVIHNASFERSVFKRFGIAIEPVVDTLSLSRKLRGKIDGGHGLKAVCARELGVMLDKSSQTSNWARRPLSARQLAYAAVDADVLVRLADVLQNGANPPSPAGEGA
ncbi:MAG: DEAD/DEAH box helicase [Deltaproteobacteria bacterium]|nr:DEAD/DEAH box helicase [Deltaproteobacteria bacterium]